VLIGYGIAGNRVTSRIPRTSHACRIGVPASAWNIPGHVLSGIIAYQALQQENPQTIEKVKTVLEQHPWYSKQWPDLLIARKS